MLRASRRAKNMVVQSEAIAGQAKDLPVIVARDVEEVYDTGKVRVHALRGVYLEITRGEMVAIMGPSGCGKTTLLNVLSGLDEVSSGNIVLDGLPMESL